MINPSDRPQSFLFMMFPGFSMVSLGAVIEPLRIANEIMRGPAYDVSVVTATNQPVHDANNIAVAPTRSFQTGDKHPDFLFVCTGQTLNPPLPAKLGRWIERVSRHGSKIGAIGTGAFSLAKLRLLDDYRCTTHWKYAQVFRETYPNIDLTNGLFEIDRNRMTAAGGTAGMDMILQTIAEMHGKGLALQVSETLLHPAIRFSDVAQQKYHLLSVKQKSVALWKAIRIMEQRIEEPAKSREIARTIGISTRQLERLFKNHLGCTPAQYYKEIRLQCARQMVHHTEMPIREISIATGFGNPAIFANNYRQRFSQTPTKDRG